MTGGTIAERLAEIRRRIAAAALRSGRSPEEITLVAVTKYVEIPRIVEAVEAGAHDLGENYVQEAIAKQSDGRIPPASVRWHLIGHLQRNKVRDAVDHFALIHSVDSLALARELGERAIRSGREVGVLLQVRLDPGETRFGIDRDDTTAFVDAVRTMRGVKVLGLMGMAPFSSEPESSRIPFRSLNTLFQALPTECRQVLSMGMTADYEVAIEEGATLVRIGTAIFGPRATR